MALLCTVALSVGLLAGCGSSSGDSQSNAESGSTGEGGKVVMLACEPEVPAEKTASVNDFLDALLEERGHEFYYEGHRRIDLIRFNKYYTIMDAIGCTPTSQYFPIPNYAVDQATDMGYTLTQYFTRPDYDGPQR